MRGDAEKVAQLLELSHETYTSVQKYNDENSLSCAITMAYFTAPAYYTVIRELASGKGFADMVFIPRSDSPNKPAMIIELKWDKDADTIEHLVRGLNSWPSAYTRLNGKQLKIWQSHVVLGIDKEPGTVCEVTKDAIVVATGKDGLAVTELQLEGKKRMAARDFLAGRAVEVGTKLG